LTGEAWTGAVWISVIEMNIAMNHEHLELLLTREMPYGKYKGRLIADLPGNYLNWFARKGFPPGELGQLLALMQELDHNGLSSLLDPLRKEAGRRR
jgi:uncharacterized protein (DUF3820 family)